MNWYLESFTSDSDQKWHPEATLGHYEVNANLMKLEELEIKLYYVKEWYIWLGTTTSLTLQSDNKLNTISLWHAFLQGCFHKMEQVALKWGQQ